MMTCFTEAANGFKVPTAVATQGCVVVDVDVDVDVVVDVLGSPVTPVTPVVAAAGTTKSTKQSPIRRATRRMQARERATPRRYQRPSSLPTHAKEIIPFLLEFIPSSRGDHMTHNLTAETLFISGHNGDDIEAYLAVPTDRAACGSIVVIHHLPGYDESTKEITRRFAAAGYAALMPNLYHRIAPGADPDDAAAAARARGGVTDAQLVGDVAGAQQHLAALAATNGKVAAIGFCSGGRQAVLVGCHLPLQGIINCYGAYVVLDSPAESPLRANSLLPQLPNLACPMLGLFGAEDSYPSVEQTAILEAALTEAGKAFEFHTYDNAGHAFFAVDRPAYRPEVAAQAWGRIVNFLERTIS